MPLALFAVVKIPIGSSSVQDWLPEGRQERQRYERFCKQFGGDQVLLVSWDQATVDDPRISDLVDRLRSSPAAQGLFARVTSPVEIIQSLQSPPMRLEPKEIGRRLQGTLIGPKDIVPIIVSVSAQGAAQHHYLIQTIRQLADDVPGLGHQRLKLVGAVYESHAIDVAAEKSMKQLVIPSSVFALLVSWWCLRSLRAVLVVMVLAGVGQLASVAVVFYGGYQFGAVLIVLPTLIFMLTLAGAIHLINYLLESKRQQPSAAGIEAVYQGWWPCLLASLTTMLGMASLLTSQLAPVRQFGMLSAICLGISTSILLLGFPATADLMFGWLIRKFRPMTDLSIRTSATAAKPVAPPSLSVPPQFAARYLAWLIQRSTAIALLGLVILVLASLGLTRLRSSTKFSDMFAKDHPSHQDMIWYEENIGSISTVEVLLQFQRGSEQTLLDEVRLLNRVTQQLRESSQVGAAFSAASILPTIPESSGARATLIRSLLRAKLEANLEDLQGQGLVSQTEESRTWRVSARVTALSSSGYDHFIEQVRQQVLAVTEKSKLPVIIETTGLTPVMYETQLTILTDLKNSFLWAYLLITPAMMLAIRGFWGGVLLMLPNVLPIAVVFGLMGWLGQSLDIAGILTASVALGIAVDDTLHFTCWYVRSLDHGRSPPEAMGDAFHACASAMIHTTLISACSMLPLLLADFEPTKQFAKLMIGIMFTALIADLLLLPALLLSPLGRVIRSRKVCNGK